MSMVLGIDFDNTIVDYDRLIYQVAVEQKLVKTNVQANKKVIRDLIRRLPDGDVEWQKVQGLVYGSRIDDAIVAPGLLPFLKDCSARDMKFYIVSHKTQFASYDETRTDLRGAARAWLNNNLDVQHSGLGLSKNDVYFESTRAEKISRIKHLQCTHFIDDLEETFLEKSFPVWINKILYSNSRSRPIIDGIKMIGDWSEISDYFLLTETSKMINS